MVDRKSEKVRVHLVDGTYELFRHFFGAPPRAGADGVEIGAVRGVLTSVVAMLADGATHVGVATDHVIESFRNGMWPGYKTGSGIDPVLRAQFVPLEEALVALGVCVWPMVDLEADDALASAAAVAADDAAVDQVVICTPDKDLAQCVVGTRVVQLDRRAGTITDEDGVRAKFGVDPASIPDWLALVGDSADGFPGIAGWGKKTAAVVLAHYGHIADIPDRAADWDPRVVRSVRGAATLAARLAEERATAMLFRDLATLRVDRTLLVPSTTWPGGARRPAFAEVCRELRDPGLAERAAALAPPEESPRSAGISGAAGPGGDLRPPTWAAVAQGAPKFPSMTWEHLRRDGVEGDSRMLTARRRDSKTPALSPRPPGSARRERHRAGGYIGSRRPAATAAGPHAVRRAGHAVGPTDRHRRRRRPGDVPPSSRTKPDHRLAPRILSYTMGPAAFAVLLVLRRSRPCGPRPHPALRRLSSPACRR